MTKADWLRSEIEKLEGESEKRTFMDEECRWCGRQFCDLDGNCCLQRVTHNTALTSIITRYKEELKVLESK